MRTSIIMLLLSVVVISTIRNCTGDRRIRDKDGKRIEVDSVQITRDVEGLSRSKTSVINSNNILDIESKNQEIRELQKLIGDYKSKLKKQGSVTNFTSNTDLNFKIVTEVDTVYVYRDGEEEQRFLFLSQFNLDNWVTGLIETDIDTTKVSMKIRNEYAVVIGEESQGLFKPKKQFVEVMNKNPYSETVKLKTYQVESPKDKKFSVGPYVGYGVNSDLKSQATIGVGVQYNIYKF